ncbi:MAG: PAS domain-containing protein [Spirochaetes bacterium]|jgi:two-component sensor histidine kinase/sensor domain CHASE-containing protein|nr:PAS domain-containing protein [Spirochaetota bacterium]
MKTPDYRSTPFLAAGAVLVILLGLWVAGLGWYRNVLIENVRAEARQIVSGCTARLSGTLQENRARLDAMATIVSPEVSSDLLDGEFNAFARGLLQGQREIVNISIAPNGVQTYVYPPEQADAVAGHDLLNDARSEVRAEAREAMSTGTIVPSGPYELRQGGHGFVLRKGILAEDDAWGLVAVVLDVEGLMEEAGMAPRMREFVMGVRTSPEDRVFYGSSEAFAGEAVTGSVNALGDVWQIGAFPVGGFDAAISPGFDMVLWLTLLAVILLAGLAYFISAHAEEELASERRLLKGISETSPVGIVVLNSTGTITFTNPHAREVLGAPDLGERPYADPEWGIRDLDGHPLSAEESPFRRVVETGRTVIDARHEIHTAGERRVVSVNAAPLNKGVVAIIQDVTEQVDTERRIRAALREKDVLLREIHHRVKNNLAIITSLLSLQQNRIRSADEAVFAFTETQSRVQALAQLHQMLYQSENLEVIDLADYVADAVRRLQNVYDPYGEVEIALDLATVRVDMDHAIPAGLVVTELLTNAFKHGAPESGAAIISVSLKYVEDTRVDLEVCDNGRGMLSETEGRDDTSLGMELVGALTQQLNGELDFDALVGTCFRLRFAPGSVGAAGSPGSRTQTDS